VRSKHQDGCASPSQQIEREATSLWSAPADPDKAIAIAYALIETAKLDGVDPQARLNDVPSRIADHKITRIGESLPLRYAASAASMANRTSTRRERQDALLPSDRDGVGSTVVMGEKTMSYVRFASMIGVATLVMFGLMYLNTYALDHVWFSETRAYMALVMGATMAIIMLGFMLDMYLSRGVNITIFALGIVLFAASLWLVRSQQTIDDVSYMKAMIPHHSIAILTSRRAHIKDERVRELADEIIAAQLREIEEMKQLIADLEANPLPADAPDLPPGE
jgi:hypothetical protein